MLIGKWINSVCLTGQNRTILSVPSKDRYTNVIANLLSVNTVTGVLRFLSIRHQRIL